MSETSLTPRPTDWDGTVNYRSPGSTLVLRADAPRAEWLEARRSGFGASDASKVLGISPYGDMYSVWLEKTGQVAEREDNEAMYWGREIEPLITRRFVLDTGIPVRASGLLRSREFPFLLYTPDGFTADGGILECKTFGQWVEDDWVGPNGEELVPDLAYCQVQQGLIVTGRSHAWIAGLGSGRSWYVRRVEADKELQAMIVERTRTAWGHVQDGTEPPAGVAAIPALLARHPFGADALDLTREDGTDELERGQAARAAYLLAGVQEAAAKKAKDQAKATILQITGDAADVTLAGAKAWTYRNTGVLSVSRWKDLASIEQVDAVTRLAITVPDVDATRDAVAVKIAAALGLDLEAVAVAETVDTDAIKALDDGLYTQARARVLRVTK